MMDFGMTRRSWLFRVGGLLATGPLLAASPSPDRLNDAAEKGRKFLRDLFDHSLQLLPEFRGSGIFLFSGLLYAWLATGRRFFVYPVPAGGVAFIIGWLLLAMGALGLWGQE